MTIPEAQLTVDVLRGFRGNTQFAAMNPRWSESLSSAIEFLEGWIATQEVIERAAKLGEAESP